MSHLGSAPILLFMACTGLLACGDKPKARNPADDELTIVVQTDKSRIAAQEATLNEQRQALELERRRLRQEVEKLDKLSEGTSEVQARVLLERAVKLVRDQEEIASRRDRLVEERDVLLQRLVPLAASSAGPAAGAAPGASSPAAPSQGLARVTGAAAEREKQAALREKAVAEREQDFAEREKALAARERGLAAREAALAQRDAAGERLARREAEKGERVTSASVERSYRDLLGAMEAKGLLAADLAPGRQRALQEAAGFRGGGDLAKAMAAIESLDAAVGALAVDGDFVSRKVERVNAMHSAVQKSIDAKMREEVGKRLQEVARAYSDGRYGEANRALNAIVLMLDRPR